MKLFETYIVRRVGMMFLVALLPVLAIIWTTQVLQRINLVTDSGQSMGSFAKLATLILPTIIPIVLPFALVIGITQTLTAMNSDSELTVMEAAGAKRSIIIRPIMILAIAISVFSFFVDNVVEPRARVAARQMVAEAYADLLSTVIEEKNFRRIEDGLYVQISQRLSGRILKGLFVVDSRDPAFDLIYYAKEGAVDPSGTSLLMKDGEVHRKTPDGTVSVIKFDSYSFDLSDMTQSRGQPNARASDRSLGFLLNPDTNDPDYKQRPGDYRAELHRRLNDWALPAIFALISLVIAGDARSHREARLHPMVSALGIAFALRWADFYAANQIDHSTKFIGVLYGINIIAALIAIVLLLRSRKMAMPVSIRNRLNNWRQKIQDRMPTAPGSSNGGGA
ncbi:MULTISPECIES: LptF/LptG family permease [unclassified Rhizobium]|uniref:LptF/LptG family permease n=1 Tax=unclassified Rhizobium TaxID=2613769 RepID=UPI000DD9F4EC|nr:MULTISPECIES: LptF/LptG family permease [unclassified Rhizobium]MBB3382686.1 lipopolysaccharide export system permease protein [Rhizobium sp. BK098]MBB3425327.1 lipopolysaccharide export system permease protein [Rhizobium sp. BK312]MBB3568589.1 lipopolysaccharide export system permease protein [Rhizobium sp. BK491]MBB3614387.1 lipopolysaccharide export system permease protein [Rhizobium sp. BK609]MBB3680227.1 lipopolysaccharide export system permease protein [Rhizobium sp. BK612]